MSKFSDEIRKNFRENDEKRDVGLTVSESIEAYVDIIYGDDGFWQSLDVYRPKGQQGALPVIVSVHGGGWVYGDKEIYRHYCMSLAEKGFAVVNFTYRLAPEFKFPTPVCDTIKVFQWIKANKETYGMDISNVFAVGDSAGANILCNFIGILTNNTYRDKMNSIYGVQYPDDIYTKSQYEAVVEEKPDAMVIKAVGLNCGAYYIDDSLMVYMAEYITKGDENAMELLDISPIVTKDFPAAYIMTGTEDFLKYQPEKMINSLTQNMVPFIFRMYGDAKNRLTHVFHCDIKTKDAKLCNKDQCEFFKSFI